jgi:hypothetical protein
MNATAIVTDDERVKNKSQLSANKIVATPSSIQKNLMNTPISVSSSKKNPVN